MNKKGVFIVDAAVAMWIVGTLALIVVAFSYFSFRTQQSHRIYTESIEIIWNHMDELSLMNDWFPLHGQSRAFNDNLRCSYEVSATVYYTTQLRTRFFINGREHLFLLERGTSP